MAVSLRKESRRKVSSPTFTVKVIAGRCLCFGVFCLRETRLAQAAIALEDLPACGRDRLGTDRGEFVVAVKFVEGAIRNPEPAQAIHALEKLAFAGNGADHQMRVRLVAGEKGFCNLDGCVTGLDDLLRKGEIVPDEEVDVRRLALRELHGWLLLQRLTCRIVTSWCGPVKTSARTGSTGSSVSECAVSSVRSLTVSPADRADRALQEAGRARSHPAARGKLGRGPYRWPPRSRRVRRRLGPIWRSASRRCGDNGRRPRPGSVARLAGASLSCCARRGVRPGGERAMSRPAGPGHRRAGPRPRRSRFPVALA